MFLFFTFLCTFYTQTFDVLYDSEAPWMRDSLINTHLSHIYGWSHSDSPLVYFGQFQPRCNQTLCGYQEYKINLGSKAIVAEIVREQNLVDFVPESFTLDEAEDLENFEASIPCEGKNNDWIFKRHFEEFGRGLSIPQNYEEIRRKYIVPFEDWCHPLYKNRSYSAVSVEEEDRIWANRRRVVAQKLITPYQYKGMRHFSLRFYLVSFYPSKMHYLYTIPRWIFYSDKYGHSNINSIKFVKKSKNNRHNIPHHDVDIPIEIDDVFFVASKLFEQVEVWNSNEASKTNTWEITAIDFLIDEDGKLRFLLDITQGPIVSIDLWHDFFELFFDLNGFPTHRDFCSKRFMKLKTSPDSVQDEALKEFTPSCEYGVQDSKQSMDEVKALDEWSSSILGEANTTIIEASVKTKISSVLLKLARSNMQEI